MSHKKVVYFRLYPFLILLFAWVNIAGAAGPSNTVLINEIMYHPSAANAGAAYVELVNATDLAIDLSGWQFTKGIAFTFPANTILPARAYLVVAADSTAFARVYPAVANFIAGWTGNMGLDLRLEDSQAQVINEVSYAPDGDWATRQLGQPMYNHRGWEWVATHDGSGPSLELVNATLPNTLAQNWTSSASANGTPGRVNSTVNSNIAPLISSVIHSPSLPGPSDPVTISARILDESAFGLTVDLLYRVASTSTPGLFTRVSMLDDGQHGDGLASDGIYGVVLPPRATGTIIEFYLEAKDAGGNTRVYPRFIQPTDSPRTANLLYQVSSETYTGGQPIYRLIMSEMERAELYALGRACPDSDSDGEMNATWITSDGILSGGTAVQVRYNVGVRNRGHGSRQANPNNYHVSIPSDRLWKKQAGVNLNSQYAHNQILGSAVFRAAGLQMPDASAVQVRVNNTNLMSLPGLPDNNSYGSYSANEQYNEDFIKRSFPNDAHGNSYRGIRDSVLCDPAFNGVADLTWHGNNYAISSYTNAYFKQNNLVTNDWSDLIDLVAVLNSANGHASVDYVRDVQQRMNVEEWMRYMAVNTLIDNDETALANGVGDDYALYRGANDTRFLALPYDLDTVLGRGITATPPRHSLFRMTTLATMDKFMKTPEFAPIYYRLLKQLAETTFSPAQMNALIDEQIGGFVPGTVAANMKAFNAAQVDYVLSQIPLTLTATSSLVQQSGFFRTTTPSAILHGAANAIETTTVLVNGIAANWTAWNGTWTNSVSNLRPGINRIIVQALDSSAKEIERTTIDVWYDNGATHVVGGAISADTLWTAAGGPYSVTSTLTVNAGATLTIEPGTTVYLGASINMNVASGGRILAEGTATAPIRISSVPGGGAWGTFTINGGVGTPETRLSYIHFEGNGGTCIEVAGGTIYLDHGTFGTTTHQYLSLDNSSFLLSHCTFPTSTAAFELLHGNGGIKTGGHGIIRECFFGKTTGFNDIMDFTGGNRPNQPIVQYYNNVFIGGTDDLLDLDGTDAWIEGNIFMHNHRNGSPDSSSAISGGNYDFGGTLGVQTSEITVIGNYFFDCDNAATAKEANFYTFLNNTIVHTTKTGGEDFASGVVNVRDFPAGGQPTAFGRGFYLEGNIILDTEQLVRNYDALQVSVTFNNNIISLPWTGPGTGNRVVDPLLRHVPQVSETQFTSWEQAQVMKDWLGLQAGSPALGKGPNGTDLGAGIPLGVSISGEPTGSTRSNSATLVLGTLMQGSGIPTAGFPSGSGFVTYRWKLDGGAFSAEVPIGTPIQLSNLSNGSHQVSVIGKNDALTFQDDPALGSEAFVSVSKTWVVDPGVSHLVINEVLAQNVAAVQHGINFPDLIELYNNSSFAADLSGMGITDDSSVPFKYTFPAGISLNAGEYLILYADSDAASGGVHLGFGLKQDGGSVTLHDAASRGGQLLDTIAYGIQIADYSIGRLADGTWGLCIPTFGGQNSASPYGNSKNLRINEWLADAHFRAANDFVELYNPDPYPTPLGGLYLSDVAGSPALNPFPALSFIPARGFSTLIADGQSELGPDHLNFKLSPDVGVITLSALDLTPIDVVVYGAQKTDISEGRAPNGGSLFTFFPEPTPGGGNPSGGGGSTNIVSTTLNLLPMGASWKYNYQDNLDGAQWYTTNYADTSVHWNPSSPALFYHSSNPGNITGGSLGTLMVLTNSGGDIPTYYFRTTFVVNTNLTGATFTVTTVVDDGAILYLNGREFTRVGMGSGTINYANHSSRTVTDAAPETFTVTLTNLLVGENLLAVEVHNSSATSSDICWGMALNATVSVTNITTAGQVVLNEVLVKNQSRKSQNGPPSGWVELYNPASGSIDLSDMSLSDDSANPRRWVFPAGSTLVGGGYLVIRFDPELPLSATNSAFALKGQGGSLYLFDKSGNGGSELDAISFGLQAADYSIGRSSTGSVPWVLDVPTPGAANVSATLGLADGLKINEWMASNPNGSDWFELFNSDPKPVSLEGLFLTIDLNNHTQSPIPPLSFIGSSTNGGYIQFFADKNTAAGADHANFNLSKLGTSIGIYSSTGVLINAVTFGKQVSNISQGRFPDGASPIVSFPVSSSPQESNYLPLPNVVVNEVLSRASQPAEPAIELQNSGATDLNIGGWYLGTDQSGLISYQIPAGTIIPAGDYKVFYAHDWSSAFALDAARGGQVQLTQSDTFGVPTGYRSQVKFGAAADGVSFARYTNSVGRIEFVASTAPSLGLVNSSPVLGEVVINEIMYHPVGVGTNNNVLDEFVELANVSGHSVSLFDPAFPVNTWKLSGGVGFSFPMNVSIPANGFAVVVSFDPATDSASLSEFRSRYAVPAGVPIYGPFSGHLDNANDTVKLSRPDAPLSLSSSSPGFVPYIAVEAIQYSNAVPWPTGGDGTGNSLLRKSPVAFGDDPLAWTVGAATAGKPNSGTAPGDSDGDGLADSWEIVYFGSINDPRATASADPDFDGANNLQEFIAGTNPLDAGSRLQINVPVVTANSISLSFSAVAGKSYSVLYRDSLAQGSWLKLSDVSPQSQDGLVTVQDSTVRNPAGRFYLIVTPAIP